MVSRLGAANHVSGWAGGGGRLHVLDDDIGRQQPYSGPDWASNENLDHKLDPKRRQRPSRLSVRDAIHSGKGCVEWGGQEVEDVKGGGRGSFGKHTVELMDTLGN